MKTVIILCLVLVGATEIMCGTIKNTTTTCATLSVMNEVIIEHRRWCECVNLSDNNDGCTRLSILEMTLRLKCSHDEASEIVRGFDQCENSPSKSTVSSTGNVRVINVPDKLNTTPGCSTIHCNGNEDDSHVHIVDDEHPKSDDLPVANDDWARVIYFIIGLVVLTFTLGLLYTYISRRQTFHGCL